MPLLNLPAMLVPNAPKKGAGQKEFLSWAAGITQLIDGLKQSLETAVDAFVNSSAQIGDDVITATHITAESINATHITSTGAVITQAIQVQDAIITDAKIVTLDGQKIIADTITSTQIAASAITATELAAGSIIASHITANAVTTTAIIADAVTAAKIDVAQLSAITADMGSLTAGVINGGFIRSGATSGAHTDMGPGGVIVYNAVGDVVASLSSAGNALDMATGNIRLQQGADLQMQAVASNPAQILFTNGSDTTQASLTGTSTGRISLSPNVNGASDLELGKSSKKFNYIDILGVTTINIQCSDTSTGIVAVNAGSDMRINAPTLRPATNGGSTLGDATNARWNTLYLTTGGINMSTGGTSTAAIAGGALSVPTACTDVLLVYVNGLTRKIPMF